MTSNLGVGDLNRAQSGLGFQPSVVDETDEVERQHRKVKAKIEDELRRVFRPEFLNRVDAVIIFRSLTTDQIRQIVDLLLGRLQKQLSEQSMKLEVSEAAKDLLAKEGYDRVFGARPLRRVIIRRIEDHLSEELLRGRISPGDTVVVDVSPGGGFTFRAEPGRKGNAPEAS